MKMGVSLHGGLFIAGTGTDVGKTIASGALLSWLKSKSINASYLKPVSTDGKQVGDRLVSPDAIWVRKSCGLESQVEELNPVCWTYPLSPLASARLERGEVTWDTILQRVENSLNGQAFTVCEGAGGVLVPLCQGKTILDLMVSLDFPVLLVARPDLGTINHTLLSIQAIVSRGLEIVGFVFSGMQMEFGPNQLSSTNSHLIEEYSGVSFLGQLPWMDELDADTMAHAVDEHFDHEFLSHIITIGQVENIPSLG